MARSKPENRVDEALRLARETHEMMAQCVIHTQAHNALLIALIGTLRDSAGLPPESIAILFRGAAAILDRVAPEDKAQEETLAAARVWLEETAAGFRTAIPPKGQVVLPQKQ